MPQCVQLPRNSPLNLTVLLSEFIATNGLPPDFGTLAEHYYLPLAEHLASNRASGRARIIGINGAQGTGKTTLAALLKLILERHYGLRVAQFSIDDIYLTRAERRSLARNLHPLLQTRGVPGTHDTALGCALLDGLRDLAAEQTLRIPRFDKARDERRPESEWEPVTGALDLILFEGWCVGSIPVSPAELRDAINPLEAEEDRDGTWRSYVNDKLNHEYRALFARLDELVMLKAPDFDCIQGWRWEQEQKLAAALSPGAARDALMDEAGIARFIQHYQRVTGQNLRDLPERADVVFTLDQSHHIIAARYRQDPAQ